ncbi:MAG: fused NADH-quinone oxidoreductase subunit E/endonuclease, partial [Albidovulum sp.]
TRPATTVSPKSENTTARNARGASAGPSVKAGSGEPAPEDAAAVRAKKPRTLKAPRKAGPDDLKQIKGVGPKLEALLHSLGFYHFDQLAGWTAEELAWVDENLEGFKGRASRDGWVEQARLLASGGDTEFSRRVKKGDVY